MSRHCHATHACESPATLRRYAICHAGRYASCPPLRERPPPPHTPPPFIEPRRWPKMPRRRLLSRYAMIAVAITLMPMPRQAPLIERIFTPCHWLSTLIRPEPQHAAAITLAATREDVIEPWRRHTATPHSRLWMGLPPLIRQTDAAEDVRHFTLRHELKDGTPHAANIADITNATPPRYHAAPLCRITPMPARATSRPSQRTPPPHADY